MDRGMFLGLLAVEGIFFPATYYVHAQTRGGFIRLHCCNLTCGEFGIGVGWWWGVETSLLCEQIITWDKDSLFVIREGYLGSGACYTEALTLLPSLHYCVSNLTPSPITTSESWLHREGCEMGNDPRSLRYEIHASNLYKGPGPCRFSGWVCWVFVWRK